jgi:hypothetical protein
MNRIYLGDDYTYPVQPVTPSWLQTPAAAPKQPDTNAISSLISTIGQTTGQVITSIGQAIGMKKYGVPGTTITTESMISPAMLAVIGVPLGIMALAAITRK